MFSCISPVLITSPKRLPATGATVFSCTTPSYQNFSCMNVTYVTTLKISCKLPASQMLHLAVFLFDRFFALKFSCCQQAAVISCCRRNCLLCRLSISHPQSTDRKDSTPCTPASGGQPPRAYMNFHHRTSSFFRLKNDFCRIRLSENKHTILCCHTNEPSPAMQANCPPLAGAEGVDWISPSLPPPFQSSP